MPKVLPIPDDLFAPGRRHLVLLAHHDDELPYAGLLSRMGAGDVRVIWLTNSDGLAHEDGMEPEAYGELRRQESLRACSHLGLGPETLEVLGHSEYALYALFAEMVRGEHATVPARFGQMAEEVEQRVRDFAPDVVWTLAYQGGHPEHDLMHLYAARAVRRLSADRGTPLPFYELPAYELMIVPLRFKPWRREPVHEVYLTPAQEAIKAAMLESYPTQARIIDGFRRVVSLYGALSALRLKPFTFADYGRREEFAPVPPERDYTRSSHRLSRLDIPLDDYKGTPIRFDQTLRPIAASLGLGAGARQQ